MTDARVVRADAVHEEEDDLVEAQPDQERHPCGDARVPHVKPVSRAPPLDHHKQNQQWYAILRDRNHEHVEQGATARPGVDPLRSSVVHRGACSWLRGGWDLLRRQMAPNETVFVPNEAHHEDIEDGEDDQPGTARVGEAVKLVGDEAG
jgi:hypothetical protein